METHLEVWPVQYLFIFHTPVSRANRKSFWETPIRAITSGLPTNRPQ